MVLFQKYNVALAAPCCVGGGWLLSFLHQTLGDYQDLDVHLDFDSKIDIDTISVSIVRHPVAWLQSFFHRPIYYRQNEKLCELSRSIRICSSFSDALHWVSTQNGIIGRGFDTYSADCVLRYEDLPWAAVEFVDMVGGDVEQAKQIAKAFDAKPPWDVAPFNTSSDVLFQKVMKSEGAFCERYQYW